MRKLIVTVIPAIMLFTVVSCSVQPKHFESTSVPSAPDYSDLYYWAAHPDKQDPSDSVPDPQLKPGKGLKDVDVFFLHPTIYTGKPRGWNGDLHDSVLNKATDESTILHQASIFNSVGNVFAPRYRQAHLQAFFTKDHQSANEALELAYSDISFAFQYYMKHWNHGRPFIIAAHSQGSKHAVRLLKEFIDNSPLQKKLVVAYIVGWPVGMDEFDKIPVCQSPQQTQCFCSWRTVKEGYYPKGFPKGDSIAVVNPLSWKMDHSTVGLEYNEGTVLRKFELVRPGLADAQVSNGFLWTHKPRFPGSILLWKRNYHIADFNFYYVNVRENAALRVKKYMEAENNKGLIH